VSTVCQYADKCPLFKGKTSVPPALEKVLRERYCNSGNVSCARYQVREALGSQMLPNDLLPTDHARAEELISRHP